MKWPLARRLTRRHGERLLDGRVPTTDAVARLLDDARRPIRGPVDGEVLAARAFRAAAQPLSSTPLSSTPLTSTPTTVSPTRSTPVQIFTSRRLVAVKVLAIGAATVTIGGVALAATVTGLPAALMADSAPITVATSSVAPSASAGAHRPVGVWPTRSPSGAADESDGHRGGPAGHGALPEKYRLAAACMLWHAVSTRPAIPAPSASASAHPRAEAAKAAREKALSDLYAAAGGQEKTAQYCSTIKPFPRPFPARAFPRTSMRPSPWPSVRPSLRPQVTPNDKAVAKRP